MLNNLFFAHIRDGNTDIIEHILHEKRDLLYTTYYNNISPLQLAIRCGWNESAKLLIELGADVNHTANGYWTPLFDAIDFKMADIIRALLKAGANPNSTGYSPLLQAIEGNYVEAVKLLVDAGADPNTVVDVTGKQVLTIFEALSWSTPEVVRLVIAGGVDVNIEDEDGSTPLHYTASGGDLELTKLLLASGADASARDNKGFTPLTAAGKPQDNWGLKITGEDGEIIYQVFQKQNQPYILKLLAEHIDNSDINILDAASLGDIEKVMTLVMDDPSLVESVDEYGYTALHRASSLGHIEIVRFLISRGADVNSRANDETPLYIAARYGNVEIAELLIKAGADPNARDDCNSTPLHEAVTSGPEMIRLLVSAGADVNTLNSDGDAPIHMLYGPQMYESAKVLIDAGADIHTKGFNGETPLHSAASECSELVNLLLEHGADIYAKDDYGRTPLNIAIQSGNEDCIRLLRDAGEPVVFDLAALGDLENIKLRLRKDPYLLTSVDMEGRTLLHYAAETDKTDIAAFLIDSGSDVNVVDNRGFTPLHTAAKSLSSNVARLLIARGADVNSQAANGDNHTPLHEAAYEWDRSPVEIIQLLLDAGADPNIVADCGCTSLGDAHRNDSRQLLWRRGGHY